MAQDKPPYQAAPDAEPRVPVLRLGESDEALGAKPGKILRTRIGGHHRPVSSFLSQVLQSPISLKWLPGSKAPCDAAHGALHQTYLLELATPGVRNTTEALQALDPAAETPPSARGRRSPDSA